MRTRSLTCRVALGLLLLVCLPGVSSTTFAALGQAKPEQPKVSAAEQKAIDAITAAPDAAAKLKAGAAFVKKYPQSTLRSRVAQSLLCCYGTRQPTFGIHITIFASNVARRPTF